MLLCVLVFVVPVASQQTILNVPSADILEKGKAYFELDIIARRHPPRSTWAPRLVYGVGNNIEAGFNFTGLAAPQSSMTTLSPAIKCRFWQNEKGWSLLVGDNVFVPLHNRSYSVGNYVYGQIAKTFSEGLRITIGTYHFSSGVVSSGQRAGAQFAVEIPVSRRVAAVADWYTGRHASGYLALGTVIKATPRLTLYPAYMIGNEGVSRGNHQFEFEIGWNFN